MSLALQVQQRLGEERDALAQDRPFEPQRGEYPVDRLLGVIAEPAQRPQHSTLVKEGEGGGIDVQLVAQGGEHRIGHLGRVRCGREGPRHGLHPLRGLGRHAPPPLVPRL